MEPRLFLEGNNNPPSEDVEACRTLLLDISRGFEQLEPKIVMLERDINNL